MRRGNLRGKLNSDQENPLNALYLRGNYMHIRDVEVRSGEENLHSAVIERIHWSNKCPAELAKY